MLALALGVLVVSSTTSLPAASPGPAGYASSARLVDAPIRLAQAPAPSADMSFAELQAEYQRLSALRPSLATPIVLLVLGGVMTVVGLYAGLYGLVGLFGSMTSTILLAALVGVAMGICSEIAGGVLMGSTIRQRREIGREMKEIKARMDLLRGGGDPAPPPAPPPIPPQVSGPQPSLLLARF